MISQKIGIQLRIGSKFHRAVNEWLFDLSRTEVRPSVRSVVYHQPLTMCTCGRQIAIILFFPGPIIMWFPVSYRAPDTGRFLISSRDPALAFLPAASFLPSSTSAAGALSATSAFAQRCGSLKTPVELILKFWKTLLFPKISDGN